MTAEDSRREALRRLREYRENEPGVPFKLRVARVPLQVAGLLAALLLSVTLTASAAPATCKVNVHEATSAQLQLLPGVGATLATRIATVHPKDQAQLDGVKGVGPSRLRKMVPFVAYAGPTTCTAKQGGAR